MNRLKIVRKEHRLTQKEVADIVGIGQSGYSFWESGRSKIDDASLKKLAAFYGTSVDYLLGGDAPPSKGVRIPVYGDVAAGLPIEAIQDIVDYEEIDAAMAATGDFFGLRVKGSSMEPRIREGDVVIVRKQSDADTGDTAIVMVNGDSATVKRIKKEPSGISLIPNNPAYDIRFFTNEEIEKIPVRIIGKVVELRGKF